MSEKILAEQIANQLRGDIHRGKLLPGASIKERDNAIEMGVSRTPLREAIRILAKEGLIELRPARSPIVAVPSRKQISDDVEFLLALETLSGELACHRATDADIDGIANIQKKLESSIGQLEPYDRFEMDMSFHRAIALAAHNTPLAEIHQNFLSRMWRGRFLAAMKRGNRKRVVVDHNTIVAALRNRDAETTRAAIQIHMHQLQTDIVNAISQEIKAGFQSASEDQI
jgi:DNA-binding GntR family transcriptional regulator